MQTISQMRSKVALGLLAKIGEEENFKKDEEIRKEFTNFTKSVPTMILQNGLGQALAFIRAKAKRDKKGKKFDLLYKTVNQWLIKIKFVQDDVLKEIQDVSAQEYMKIQTETLKFLEWVKRYATADIFE